MAKTSKNSCELCAFNNPKCSTAGVIIYEGRVLLLKRSAEPFKGMWDFPGGYVNAGERPDKAMTRELKEELNISPINLDLINVFPGTASYKSKEFAVMNFAYLVEMPSSSLQEIKIDKENSQWRWFKPKEVSEIAFDSNKQILDFIQRNFSDNWERVKDLVRQLDPSADPKEINLYRAILNGYVSRIYNAGDLVGMGWIFPRQTLLRKQAVIEDMIVDEKYRGAGRGESMLRDLLHWAKEQDCQVIELTTNPKREAANLLYQKVGFKLHPTNHYLLQL